MPGLPRLLRTHRSRARRIAGGLAFVVLLAAALPQPAGAFSDPGLKKAHHQLRQTRERIHAKAAKLQAIQNEMSRLATEIHKTYEEIFRTRIQMGKLQAQLKPLRKRLDFLKGLLASRSREAFIMGPGPPTLYLVTATPPGEAAPLIRLIHQLSRG